MKIEKKIELFVQDLISEGHSDKAIYSALEDFILDANGKPLSEYFGECEATFCGSSDVLEKFLGEVEDLAESYGVKTKGI